MPGHELNRGVCRLIGVLLLLPALGCAVNTAPRGFLPSPVESQKESYGGWIELEVDRGNKKTRRVEGELLAVSATQVWLAGDSGGMVVAMATVKQGYLTGYRSSEGAVAGYTLLGTLSTASNGWLLVFTAPLWIIAGSAAAATESRQPVRKSPPLQWPELATWARFPRGMPEGVDLGTLRSTPRRR